MELMGKHACPTLALLVQQVENLPTTCSLVLSLFSLPLSSPYAYPPALVEETMRFDQYQLYGK